jgi:two-component system sensor histidine kinase YesM
VTFNLDFDETLSDLRVLRNVLQPIVENAIFHGIEPTGRAGRIEIRVFKEQEQLIYSIEDNGVGIDPADIARLFERTEVNNRGFAIKNIRDRLKLLYGLDDALVMENRPSGGCLVKITQPVTGGLGEYA